jgi:hypothetical protein
MSCQLPQARLLVDVDAMCKLAHWRLLELLDEITGVPPTLCAALPSCQFRANKSLTKPDRVLRSSAAAQTVLQAISTFGSLPQPEPESLSPFQEVAGIDSGEAVMLALMLDNPATILLTGDKRAMRALAALEPKLRERFAARILPIECIVKCILDARGLDELRARVCPWKDVDTAISNVMGSRCDQGEASVREGLASYLNELRQLCEPPLIHDCG